jgi:acetylglutamate kinase
MIVIKYGGHAMTDAQLAKDFARDLAQVVASGQKVVVVHGGGPQIEHELHAREITSTMVSGLRVTTPEVMEVVEMVLAGRVLRDVTGLLNQAGASAVGITGCDGGLLMAERLTHSASGEVIDVGQVGEISSVNPQIIHTLIDAGFLPVIAPISTDGAGTVFNVNADSAALEVDRVIFLTDVPGVFRNWPDESSLIPHMTYEEAEQLLPLLTGGMIPKVGACMRAIAQGAKSAQILDGRVPGIIKRAVSQEIGTVITP